MSSQPYSQPGPVPPGRRRRIAEEPMTIDPSAGGEEAHSAAAAVCQCVTAAADGSLMPALT